MHGSRQKRTVEATELWSNYSGARECQDLATPKRIKVPVERTKGAETPFLSQKPPLLPTMHGRQPLVAPLSALDALAAAAAATSRSPMSDSSTASVTSSTSSTSTSTTISFTSEDLGHNCMITARSYNNADDESQPYQHSPSRGIAGTPRLVFGGREAGSTLAEELMAMIGVTHSLPQAVPSSSDEVVFTQYPPISSSSSSCYFHGVSALNSGVCEAPISMGGDSKPLGTFCSESRAVLVCDQQASRCGLPLKCVTTALHS